MKNITTKEVTAALRDAGVKWQRTISDHRANNKKRVKLYRVPVEFVALTMLVLLRFHLNTEVITKGDYPREQFSITFILEQEQ